MARPEFAEIPAYEVERYRDLLGEDYAEVAAAAERARGVFAGRTVWNVNSTAHGRRGRRDAPRPSPLRARGRGRLRWVVLRERARVLRVDQAPAQQPARRLGRRRRRWASASASSTRAPSRTAAASSPRSLKEGDIVFLHDPQTAGLVPAAKETGASGRLALPHRRRRAGRARPVGPGTSSRPYVDRRRRLRLLPARATSGTGSTASGSGDAAVDRPLLAEEPGARRGDGRRRSSASIGLGDGRLAAAPSFTRADGTPGRRRAPRRGRPGRAASRPGARRRPGLALGPPQGPSPACSRCFERHLGDADAPPRPRRARRPRRSPTTPRARRSGGRSRDAWRDLAADGPPPRPPRQPADGRHRRERGDGQRAPAARRRRRPEEPRRGLRPDGRRGDVEAAAGDRQPGRRDPGPDRRRRERHADRRPPRPRGAGQGDPVPRRRPRARRRDRRRRAESASARRYLSPIRLAEYVDLLSSIEPGGAR